MSQFKNGYQKILTVILTVIIASAAIVGGAYAYKIWIAPTINQPETEADNNQLIGGQKDEHGCLIGAGYSWCETKQKCLRIWEETCAGPQDEQGIKQAFVDKYNKPLTDITVQISQNDGTYAKGSVTFGQGGPGEGGYFFAYKKDGGWKVVADGNGSVSCRYLKYYGFPDSMTDNFCYDSGAVNDFSESGNLVLRQQDGGDRWVLIYEKPGQPALSANLTFIGESFCDLGSGLAPCDTTQFAQGQRVLVVGQKVSAQGVTVWNLKIIK
jgi:hypothetical protein